MTKNESYARINKLSKRAEDAEMADEALGELLKNNKNFLKKFLTKPRRYDNLSWLSKKQQDLDN